MLKVSCVSFIFQNKLSKACHRIQLSYFFATQSKIKTLKHTLISLFLFWPKPLFWPKSAFWPKLVFRPDSGCSCLSGGQVEFVPLEATFVFPSSPTCKSLTHSLYCVWITCKIHIRFLDRFLDPTMSIGIYPQKMSTIKLNHLDHLSHHVYPQRISTIHLDHCAPNICLKQIEE